MSTWRAVTVTTVSALLALTACTSDTAAPGPGPSELTSTTPQTPRPTNEPVAASQPLALAINIRRGVLNLPVHVARRITDGDPVTWARLGQPGGEVDVRTGATALDAVERDADVLAVVPAARLRPNVQAVTVGGVDPLRNPGSYPLTVDAAAPPPRVTTLTVVGDIMLGRRVNDVAAAAGDVSAPLRPLEDRLAAADLTAGNLESTLSRSGPPTQSDSFFAPPAVLEGLGDAGFDC